MASSRFVTRIIVLAIATGSIAAGVAAGCGFSDEGTMGSLLTGDASENVGASLPETGGGDDGSSDGARDAGGDNEISALVACSQVCAASAGGRCDDAGACVFGCDAGLCEAGVVCPAGVACKVGCALDKSCPSVDCTLASACDITCTGKDSCGTVDCAGKNCTVRCNADNTCSDGGVTCTATGTCNIDCKGAGKTCAGPIACTNSASCDVVCLKANSCLGGVTAIDVADAQVFCKDNAACLGGAKCLAGRNCSFDCTGSKCNQADFCCDASVCAITGDANVCP